mgnify:CR=1 FL=1
MRLWWVQCVSNQNFRSSYWKISASVKIGSLTLSGPRFFRYRKARGGGGWFQPPFEASENWHVEYSICKYATINLFFSFEGGRPESLENLTFLKNVKTKILIFEYFQKIPSEMNSNHSFSMFLFCLPYLLVLQKYL